MKTVSSTVVALSLAIGGWTLAYSGSSATQDQGKQGQAGQRGGQGAAQAPQAESQAFQAIQNELDPDQKLKMIDDFEKKYPSSTGLSYVLLMAADTYRQKGDARKVVEYGEKSLKIKGDNPVALILVASLLPEPQSMQGSDLDKEKKLTEAEDYALRAIKLVEQLPKQANMTDEQFQKNKADLTSWAHSSLGMVHLQRSGMALTGLDADELTKAEKEYQTAISLSANPNPGDYFRLGEALKGHGKTDEALEAFTKADELDQGGGIKALADRAIEELKKQKAGAKPPDKSPQKPPDKP
jgi:tetratricopeptide (TPR) repeat protein